MKDGVAGPFMVSENALTFLGGCGCVISLPVGFINKVESNLSFGHQCGVSAYSNLKSCSLFLCFSFPV